MFRELLFPLERRVGRSLEIGGVETRHYRGSRFISPDEFVSAAGFGELIQWKEEEEEDLDDDDVFTARGKCF